MSLMKSPVCSAVFLASGGVEQLAVSLDAAVLQLDGDIEAIAVDDGSSSAASVWLAQRKRELPALRIVEIEGAGAAQARNAAIEAARAPLIAFIESRRLVVAGQDRRAGRLPRGPSGDCVVVHRLPARHRGRRKPRKLLRILAARAPSAAQGRLFPARRRAASADRDEPGRHIHRGRHQGRAGKSGGFRSLDAAEDWDLWLRLAGEAPAACSKAVTATCLLRRPSPAQQRARVAAMEEIVSPYEEFVRGLGSQCGSQSAGAAGRGARAELARPAGLCAPRSRYRPQAFMTAPPAQPGKRTPASFLNEALYFVGPC